MWGGSGEKGVAGALMLALRQARMHKAVALGVVLARTDRASTEKALAAPGPLAWS
jgi:hypothetical protein